jgi:hypothetical protein
MARLIWDAIATRGRVLSPRLATLEPAAGGAGGTDKAGQVERLSLGTELGPALALLTLNGRDVLFRSLC